MGSFNSYLKLSNQGFTLVEMVIVIVLTGIIFSVVGVFISGPLEAYGKAASRAALVDSADLAMRRMERDIKNALPNSLRVKTVGTVAVEMMNIVEGIRYRASGPGAATDILSFTQAVTEFSTLGQFQVAQLGSQNYRLAIYNIGAYGASTDSPTPGVNVYSLSNAIGPIPPSGTHVITPAGISVTLSNPSSEGHVVLGAPHQFAFSSTRQRLYVVDSPITYLCDLNAGTLTRYSNYSISESQPSHAGTAPLSSAQSALLAQNVSSCSFEYQPGTSQRHAIITLALTVSNGAERVRLLQQVSVNNAP